MDDLYQKYYNEYHRIEKLRETRQRIGSSRPTTNSSHRNRRGSDKYAMLGSSVENAHSSSTPSSNSDKNDNEMANLSYADPLGPMAERPRTGKIRHSASVKEESDEEFDAEELLPI